MSGMEDDTMGAKPRSEAVMEAWKQTNEEMEAIAERRRDDGWEVTTMPAVHSSPVDRDVGDPDEFGLIHIVPDNYADAFTEAYEQGSFPRYEVYRNQVDGYVFLVTELMDPDSETAILVASNYDLQHAVGMVRSALDEGVFYTHYKTLDGTKLGSASHDEFVPFVPDVEQFKEAVEE